MKEATREAILAAAESVIGQLGPSPAKVEDIARAAGVSVGTVYNHFEDREAVVSGLMDLRLGELLSELDAAIHEVRKAPFEQRLRAFISAPIAHFEEHRLLFAAILEGEAHRRGGDSKRLMVKELTARAEVLVKAGVKEGALRAQDQELLPTFLISAIRAVLIRSFAKKSGGGDLRHSVDAVIRFFMQGAGAA